jgi:hypothetical protein
MSNWLSVSLGGLKIASSLVLVAGSMDADSSVTCLLNSSLSLAPLAWAVASQFVADPQVASEVVA